MCSDMGDAEVTSDCSVVGILCRSAQNAAQAGAKDFVAETIAKFGKDDHRMFGWDQDHGGKYLVHKSTCIVAPVLRGFPRHEAYSGLYYALLIDPVLCPCRGSLLPVCLSLLYGHSPISGMSLTHTESNVSDLVSHSTKGTRSTEHSTTCEWL